MMRADKKNFPTVYDDIRTLLLIFPMRCEAELRTAIALRLEIDEKTEKVLGDHAREKIRRAANIARTNTFDAAISAIQEKGILRIDRRYSNGSGGRIYQRGAVYVMTRESWPTHGIAPSHNNPPSPALTSVPLAQRGGRSTVVPAQRNISSPVNAGDGTTLSGEDLYKDNDEVYDEVDDSRPPSLAGANSSNEKGAGCTNDADTSFNPPIVPLSRVSDTTSVVGAASATSGAPAGVAATLDQTFGTDINALNPYADSVRRDRQHARSQAPREQGFVIKDAIHLDPRTGRVSLLNGAGEEFRQELLRDFPGIDVEKVLVASSDWITPRSTDIERKKTIRRTAQKLMSTQRSSLRRSWAKRSFSF